MKSSTQKSLDLSDFSEVSPDLEEADPEATPETSSKEPDQQNILPFKKVRKAKRKSLERVSKDLHIRLSYLQAIEESDVSQMPERVYVLGFVKSYAHYLGLNVEEILAQFKEQVLGDVVRTDLTLPEPIKELSTPRTTLIAFSLLIVALMGAWWYFAHSPQSSRVFEDFKRDLGQGTKIDERLQAPNPLALATPIEKSGVRPSPSSGIPE